MKGTFNQKINEYDTPSINDNLNNQKNKDEKGVEQKLKNIYNKINQIKEDKKKLFEKIKNIINSNKILNNYILVNKNWFNELINIFGKDINLDTQQSFVQSIYTSINKNISHCQNKMEYLKVNLRKLIEQKLLETKFNKIKDFQYPIDFEIINENFLEFLEGADIYQLKYDMIIGDNLIFIIDKNNKKISYACSIYKNDFSVETIFFFKKEEYLYREIEVHIKNKGGLENYYKERNFNPNNRESQKILNKDNKYIGEILIIRNKDGGVEENNLIKNYEKENNFYSNKVVNESINLKSDYFEKNNNSLYKENSFLKQMNNPYIAALFISLFKIDKLRINFKNIKNKTINLTNKIYNFMENNDINLSQINEIQKVINKINSAILKDINFEKLINFVLNQLHNELNQKNKKNIELPKEDYDEQMAYDNFKNYYFEQNESIIQKTFFGLKKIASFFKCCELIMYKFEIINFILLDLEKIDQQKSLQELINQWENDYVTEKSFCKMCHLDSESLIQNQLYDSPEILIIIIKNNKNKIELDKSKILKTKNYEYNLLCCISQSDKEYNKNIFNVVYKEKNNWYAYINYIGPKKVENDLESLLLYPHILFYERGNKILINQNLDSTLKKSNLRYDSILLSDSNYSINNIKYYNSIIKNNVYNIMDNSLIKKDKYTNDFRYDDNEINALDNNKLVKSKANMISVVYFINNYININKDVNDDNSNNKLNNNSNNNNNFNIINNNINNYPNDYESNFSYKNINNCANYKINHSLKSKLNNYSDNNVKNYGDTYINNKINNFNNTNQNQTAQMNSHFFPKNNFNNIGYSNFNNNNLDMKNNTNFNLNNKNLLNMNFNTNISNMYNTNIINNYFFNYYPDDNLLSQQNLMNYKFYNENSNNINIYSNYFQQNNKANKIRKYNNYSENSNSIVLFFIFGNGKELYIEVEDESLKFYEVINLLKEKYYWLEEVKIKEFLFNSEKIIVEKSIKEIGLKDFSKIRIVEY